MKENPEYIFLYRIAQQYYLEGRSQGYIAKQENISRPHVSRLLNKARQMGIVSISVELPESLKLREIAERLQRQLGLQEVILVSTPAEAGTDTRLVSEAIAHTAAEALPRILAKSHFVGVGWGYTIYQTALLQARQEFPGKMTFIPLVGISDENNPYLQSNVIVDRFAEKFQAKSYYTSVPAYLKRGSPRMSIEEDRYSRLKQQWEKLDAAIVGLGPRFSRGDFLISEASEEYKRLIASSQTVGDILANFFYKDGSVLDSSGFYEQVSLPLARLKGIRNVVCLAGGAAKVPALVTAARQGYIKTLITDSQTAEAMLAACEAENGTKNG